MSTSAATARPKVTLVDTSLRDGMSSVSHKFTPAQVAEIAGGLDKAGITTIEVAHGIGLGASSIQYGFAAATTPSTSRPRSRR
jgi:Isopropylmalate/homocitrate/citramalate synthases